MVGVCGIPRIRLATTVMLCMYTRVCMNTYIYKYTYSYTVPGACQRCQPLDALWQADVPHIVPRGLHLASMHTSTRFVTDLTVSNSGLQRWSFRPHTAACAAAIRAAVSGDVTGEAVLAACSRAAFRTRARARLFSIRSRAPADSGTISVCTMGAGLVWMETAAVGVVCSWGAERG